jgi:methyl-accepting chemotaxis protein
MHDTLLIVFTGVLAFAVLLQSLLFFGMYRSIRRISERIDDWGKDLLRNLNVISSKVEEGLTTVKSAADNLKPITQNLVGTTQIVHKRVMELDNFLAEATRVARQEIVRVQDTIEYATQKTEETVEIIQNTILTPIQEISAIARAIKVGADALFRRRRNPSKTSAQDDEMFI